MTQKKVGIRQHTSYSLDEKLVVVRLQMCKILKELAIQTLYPTGELRTQYNFDLNNIFNKDKTPVWFDMAGNMTINNKGDKTVHIRTIGNDKNYFTIVLTYDTKYPPICIFKDFLFRIQKLENLLKESVMIIYNSFCDHLEESVKTKFKQHNFHLVVIPAGLTSVKKSWNAISDQIVFNSFKKYSISNLLDESEDDMVYEEIDKLITEYEKENLEKFDDNVEIVSN
ncbi:pogo transposable element with KRAB domain [Rhizophagus clarus]|uniref:Pogo transposable element with KRAB domain n=1 Tax=Rhizophagus clarus TaxID=94130 RepID=A0A8H3LAC8_9GLOM|nr:pogo transposable element with KRAB domain [Rhizophagus clarus]